MRTDLFDAVLLIQAEVRARLSSELRPDLVRLSSFKFGSVNTTKRDGHFRTGMTLDVCGMFNATGMEHLMESGL